MKQKQTFTDRESANAAKQYLVRKCRSGEDEYVLRGAMTDQAFALAISKFHFDDEATLEIELRKFSRLCIETLTDEQWLKLRTAIRVKRKKELSKLVSIDISPDAHHMLKYMSKLLGPEVSLSQAIIELARNYRR
jgi:hypothetical protein